MSASSATPRSAAEIRRLLATRKIDKVVVLGANGTMGYGSAALFTQAAGEVTLLARSKAKAEEPTAVLLAVDPDQNGLGEHLKQVTSAVARPESVMSPREIGPRLLGGPDARTNRRLQWTSSRCMPRRSQSAPTS